ncbi:PadR family transcriptional regulator [Cryobacterium suzukii]|uniref:PadR family transcriptional regulator n=1 Tax=Cryobacterium suzukii TaxID=1259198 RepID=A0A4R9ABI5_9MICO|nr:PadR family transcriptional regulator [Cryobacterium suzukii]TFD56749.1 PadR family transcriptional regulator [Cryobacterium suzukii]
MAENPTSTQLRRGVVGPCILALLSSGPRFGLQLVRELDDVGQLLSSQGTVYPLLNRLHDAGFVTSYWEVNETDRPRRYYQLTEGGRLELASFQEDWERFSGSVTSLLATIPEKHNDRTRDDV